MIFVIGGETASGKSDLAFTFAKRINGIIINGDAFAFYKELNIGTAKPSGDELKSVPSFLFNNISVSDPYSIFEYQQDGRKIIDEYLAKNIPLIIVGGSGLYMRALLYDYNLAPERTEIIDDLSISNNELYRKLEMLDPNAAQKIHPNNRKRVLRALAIIENQGQKKSELDAKTSNRPFYPYLMITLESESSKRDEKIKKRTAAMIENGLKNEALALATKFDHKSQALQAIGYKEIIANPHLNDDELSNLISLRTRQLAKRQRTFFKHQFTSVSFTDANDALTYLLAKYEEKL